VNSSYSPMAIESVHDTNVLTDITEKEDAAVVLARTMQAWHDENFWRLYDNDEDYALTPEQRYWKYKDGNPMHDLPLAVEDPITGEWTWPEND